MKANATHSGPAAVRNPLSPANDALVLSATGPVYPGLVSHPALSPSVQVQILSIVDATGSASIGDIIQELPGHTDPVGAIFALIAADVLVVVTMGIIDADSIVARYRTAPQGSSGVPSTTASPIPPADTAASAGPEIPSVNFCALAEESPPDDLLRMPSSALQPRMIMGSGRRRAAFKHVSVLQQPGVYILLRGRNAYVGFGADVGARIAAGRQMPDGTPDTIIAIADARNDLSEDDARALERILWSFVSSDNDFSVINGVPDGAAISPNRYDQLTLFSAQAVLTLRQAGVMFLNGSVRERLAGPRAEPNRLGAPRRIDNLPDGRVMELNYCGLTALAAERDDGTWLLLRGSDVRIDTVNSASASASFQRAAWLHAGLLDAERDGSRYVLKRDISFSSGSAVSHFVSGSKGFGLSAWRDIDRDDDALAELAH